MADQAVVPETPMAESPSEANPAPATPPAAEPAAPAAETPAPAAFDWSTAITNPELLQAEVMNGVDSPDALVERAISMNSQLKAEGRVKVPGLDAPPEEIAAFRKAIGVPENGTAAEYGFTDPGYSPESGLAFDTEMADWAAETLHGAGVPKEVGKQIFDGWEKRVAAKQTADTERVNTMGTETERILRGKYGETYDQSMNEMRQTVRELAGPEDAADIEAMLSVPEIGNDLKVMNFLMNIRDFYKEAKGEEAFKRPPGMQGGGVTPAEAKADIDNMTKDRNGPYWNKDHPDHSATVTKVNRLYEAMNPDVGVE